MKLRTAVVRAATVGVLGASGAIWRAAERAARYYLPYDATLCSLLVLCWRVLWPGDLACLWVVGCKGTGGQQGPLLVFNQLL